jgi:hypothetical protein
MPPSGLWRSVSDWQGGFYCPVVQVYDRRHLDATPLKLFQPWSPDRSGD